MLAASEAGRMATADEDHEHGWTGPLEVPLLDHVADPQLLRRDQLLQATALGVTAATGEAFFRLLARHLARTLQCACAVVGLLLPENARRVRTLAFFADHELRPNI